jgi:tetratricopeptide (TPR) repeat protein
MADSAATAESLAPASGPRQTNWIALAVLAILVIGAGLAIQRNRGRVAPRPTGPTTETWVGLHNDATALRSRADYDAAARAAQAAAAVAPAVFPAEHFALPESLNLLGLILTDRGDYAEAVGVFEQAVPGFDRVFGNRTKQAAQARVNMGVALTRLGRYDAAEALLNDAIAILASATGPESAESLVALTSLAALLDTAGRADAARPIHEKILTIRRKNDGPAALSTADAMVGLASSLIRLPKSDDSPDLLEQAAQLYDDAFLVHGRLLPADSLAIANSLSGLARIRLEQGDLPAAGRMAIESLAIRQAKLGGGHPTVATSYEMLARIREAQALRADAEDFYERTIAIRSARLGPAHPLTREALGGLADFLVLQEDWEAAAKPLEALLAFVEQSEGPEAILLAEPLEKLAGVLRNVAAAKAGAVDPADPPGAVAGPASADATDPKPVVPDSEEGIESEPNSAPSPTAAAEAKDRPPVEAERASPEDLLARADQLEARAKALRDKEAERLAKEARSPAHGEAASPATGDPQPAEAESPLATAPAPAAAAEPIAAEAGLKPSP